MTTISSLRVEGYTLKDDRGAVIAELDGGLDESTARSYLNAFACSAEMLATLEKLAQDAYSEFNNQYEEAIAFNNYPARAYLGSPINAPQPPEWILNALALIARAKGDKGDTP